MRFVVAFRAVHNHFRIAELRSVLCSIRACEDDELGDLGLTSTYDDLLGRAPPLNDPLHVRGASRGVAGVVLYGEIYAYIELRDETEAAKLAQRCVLVRAILIPLGHGRDTELCIASVTDNIVATSCAPLFESPPPSYRVVVESFGRSLSVEEQLERVHAFSFIHAKFPGVVRMRDADYQLWVLEDAFPPAGHSVSSPHPPARQVLVARLVARGDAGVGAAYSLKRRSYIGPTSMDAELAFVMANMACVTPGALVLDPFAGTGGVLVACAARGAHTIAADINLLSLRGKTHNRDIWSNFAQYKLPGPLGVIRSDSLHSAFRCGLQMFDAMITDPPYGIKEGAKMYREGIDARNYEQHFQSTRRVCTDDLLWGMLNMAVDMLVDGGRLVYWLPTTPEYKDSDLPTHPLLKLVHNSEQPLTLRMSRRLIVMVRLSGKNRPEYQRQRREWEDRPAHLNLAAKLLYQPERDERRLTSAT